uniref:Uncharacterized protein n=1 Tax=Arundo donax TaxID=35708 RepID=A0A0A9GS22_ARUDO
MYSSSLDFFFSNSSSFSLKYESISICLALAEFSNSTLWISMSFLRSSLSCCILLSQLACSCCILFMNSSCSRARDSELFLN